jgi:hypothetical protein
LDFGEWLCQVAFHSSSLEILNLTPKADAFLNQTFAVFHGEKALSSNKRKLCVDQPCHFIESHRKYREPRRCALQISLPQEISKYGYACGPQTQNQTTSQIKEHRLIYLAHDAPFATGPRPYGPVSILPIALPLPLLLPFQWVRLLTAIILST